MLNNSIKYSSIYLISIEILYKFKVKKLLNLLEIDNLNLNDLATSSNISTILSIRRSKAIRRFLVKRIVAIKVSKPSTIVVSTTINIFLATSYRP